MRTVSEIAKELGLTRARVHQLIQELGLEPERIEGPFGAGFIYMLSVEDEAKLGQTKRIAKSVK